MNLLITPSQISGRVQAPPSKSHTHRVLLCSLLAAGTSHVRSMLESDDTLATLRLCESLGAVVGPADGSITITGPEELCPPKAPVSCGGSASTLRMGMAVSALCNGSVTLTGTESLNNRPIGALEGALKSLGARCMPLGRDGYPPLTVSGPLKGGEATLPGSESSQYLSALLIACPRCRLDTTITLTSPLQSKPYVDMTLACVRQFGGTIEADDNYRSIHIQGNQEYIPSDVTVEGDCSSAAFLMAAGALAGKVTVGNVPQDTSQGDRRIVDILSAFGADIRTNGDTVTVVRDNLGAVTADCSDVPDLVPILAAVATQASGTTTLENIGRLRIKESDRVATTMQELTRMGASIKADETTLYIHGPTPLSGARIATHDDHRIAMSCAVAALVAKGRTMIEDVECVNKSYPAFFSDLASIGGEVHGE